MGNTSFASKGSLIPGAQSLFGIKTQLQFGKLYVTSVFATQKSQRQSKALQGGASTSQISVRADDYDENRNFLLAQYFRDHYNSAMKNLPVVTSQVQVLRMEVWVTNRTGATVDTRDIVGLMDLGENTPYGPWIGTGSNLPSNNANNLYSTILGNPASREPASAVSTLVGLGLRQVQDFEKTYARKLDSSQYTYNKQVGYLSLRAPLQSDEVLAVAFQYTYNGRVYQVGEFSQDVPVDSSFGSAKSFVPEIIESNVCQDQSTDLETDDEEYLHAEE